MIDVHTHVVPPGLPFGRFPGDEWPRLEVGAERGEVFVGQRHFRTVRCVAWDLERRLDEMEEQGTERQVLSPMPELFCYWSDERPAREYCRGMNAWLAECVGRGHGRFEAFGIVPMQTPEQAAEMMGEVRDLGLVGVEIGSNVMGVPLHDPRFDPVFDEAERCGLTVFVHAFQPRLYESFSGASAANGVTFPNEVGFAVGGLIAEGVLDRHPNLRVCASHGGGSLGLLLPRLDRLWDFDPALAAKLPERPSVVAQRIFVDLLVFAPHALRYVVEVFGSNRVVVGSDYPFLPDRPGDVLERTAGLGSDDRKRIHWSNALALLGQDKEGL